MRVAILLLLVLFCWQKQTSIVKKALNRRDRNITTPSDAGYENGLAVLNLTEWNEHHEELSLSEHGSLWRRAPPQTYDEALARGQSIIQQTELPTDCLAQSPFANFADLNTYGWSMTAGPTLVDFATSNVALASAQHNLGVNGTAAEARISYTHDRTTPPHMVQYPPSSGYYVNVYNTQDGVIYAVSNYGPSYMEDLHALQILHAQRVPLRQWSDVAFLVWQELCTTNHDDVKGLRAIVQSNVINTDTLYIVTEVLEDDGEDMDDLPFPGVYYGKGTSQFTAILATPNCYGVAFLLWQHRNQLGWKDITGIRLYCTNYEHEMAPHGHWALYIIIYLKSVPEQQQQEWTQQYQQGQQAGPARRGISAGLTRKTSDSPPTGSKYTSFDDFVTAGKQLINTMDDASDCVQQSQWTEQSALEDWGWELTGDNTMEPSDPDMLDVLNTPPMTGASETAYYSVSHELSTQHGDTTFLKTGAFYNQYFNVHGIVVENIQGCAKMGPDQYPPVTGNLDAFPALKQWSDLTYLAWQKFHGGDYGKMQDLRVVAHIDIENQITNWVVEQVKTRLNRAANDYVSFDNDPLVVKLGSDEHAALLATPNGQGTAWFLAQHKDQLTRKEISEIKLWTHTRFMDEYNLAFYIRPNQQPVLGNVGRRKRAANDSITTDLIVRPTTTFVKRFEEWNDASNLDPQPLWSQAVEIGNHLLALLMSPASCVQQSPWTVSAELLIYGWTEYHTCNVFLDGLAFGMAYVNMFDDLSLSSAVGDLYSVDLRHTQSTQRNGRTYPPTKAQYENIYNPLAIFASSNYGPDYSGPRQWPPVQKSDFVPLRQWSDVTFLMWHDYCRGDPKAIQRLRYIVRENVINKQSRKIIYQAVRMSGNVLSSATLGWNARVTFDMDTAYAQAILSTPNGQGVAWFLAQHKAQLGQKTITQIVLFEDTQGLNAVFVLGPGPNAQHFQPQLQQRGPAIVVPTFHTTIGNTAHDNPTQETVTQGPAAQSTASEIGIYEGTATAEISGEDTATDDIATEGTATDSIASEGASINSTAAQETPFPSTEPVGTDANATSSQNITTAQTSNQGAGMIGATKKVKRGIEVSTARPFKLLRASEGTQAFSEALKRGSQVLRANEAVPSLQATFANAVGTHATPELPQPFDVDHVSNVTRAVTDETTRAVIRVVLWRLQDADGNPPKLMISTRHIEGQALLGTEAGSEVSQSIARASWPRLISHVAVFNDSDGFVLGFHIKDVPTDDHNDLRFKYGPSTSEAFHKGPGRRREDDTALLKGPFTSSSSSRTNRWVGKSWTYQDYINEGSYLLCSLYAPVIAVTQSKWTDQNALTNYGWRRGSVNWVDVSNGNPIPLGQVFGDSQIGLDSSDTDNVRVTIRQMVGVTVDGQTYPASEGEYMNVFNLGRQKGAILGDMNYGPDIEGAKQDPPVTGSSVVPLKQWSDVVFLQWQQLVWTDYPNAGSQRDAAMQRLNFVFRLRIDNAETNRIIGQVMGNQTIDLWPGKYIAMTADGGKAMLGTPHGAGVSWLLAQHKNQLGRKWVTGVTIFTHQVGHKTSLCYWLKDWQEGMTAP